MFTRAHKIACLLCAGIAACTSAPGDDSDDRGADLNAYLADRGTEGFESELGLRTEDEGRDVVSAKAAPAIDREDEERGAHERTPLCEDTERGEHIEASPPARARGLLEPRFRVVEDQGLAAAADFTEVTAEDLAEAVRPRGAGAHDD